MARLWFVAKWGCAKWIETAKEIVGIFNLQFFETEKYRSRWWRVTTNSKEWGANKASAEIVVCLRERPCNRKSRKSFEANKHQPRRSSATNNFPLIIFFLTRIHRLPTYAKRQTESHFSHRCGFRANTAHSSRCWSYWSLMAAVFDNIFHRRSQNTQMNSSQFAWINWTHVSAAARVDWATQIITEIVFVAVCHSHYSPTIPYNNNNNNPHYDCCLAVSLARKPIIVSSILNDHDRCSKTRAGSDSGVEQKCGLASPIPFFLSVSFDIMLISSGADFIKTPSQ